MCEGVEVGHWKNREVRIESLAYHIISPANNFSSQGKVTRASGNKDVC